MLINKSKLLLSTVFSIVFFVNIVIAVGACHCNLDVYTWDQDTDPLNANIYVDEFFIEYANHIALELEPGVYSVHASKENYYPDFEILECLDGETERIDLFLEIKDNHEEPEEDIRIELDDFDVSPDNVCSDIDEDVELSIDVTLESGPDNTEVTARFYVEDEDGDWDYIDREVKDMDEDETKRFSIDYEYEAYDLDEDDYEFKVVVTAEGEEEIEYADFDVEDCFLSEDDIEVGWVTITPEFPDHGDTVLISVPVSLQISHRLPDNVFVKIYVDGKLVESKTMRFQHLVRQTFTFTIDTAGLSPGTHTIEVTATSDQTTDTSIRTFSVGPEGVYEEIHCLDVDFKSDDLVPGENVNVKVKVTNCGAIAAKNVKVRLDAFSTISYGNIGSIQASDYEEIDLSIKVPEDAESDYKFSVRVWDSYTSDTMSKEFAVESGMPFLIIEPENRVEICKTNEISFTIKNVGVATETFTLSTDSSWIIGFPEKVTLEKDEMKTIQAYVIVPCDLESGYHQFTITAKNSEEYTIRSSLYVSKPWSFPGSPLGLFLNVQMIGWIPWLVLIVVLLVALLLFLYVYDEVILEKKRPMFQCSGNGC
jgi:hypothetical protein